MATVTWLKIAMYACVVSGCGRPDDAGYALVVDESQWSGVCVDGQMQNEQLRDLSSELSDTCAAYECIVGQGRMKVRAGLDPNRSYYDRHSPGYDLRSQQELVFSIERPEGPDTWQEIAVETSACVRVKGYLWPGVGREDADLQRRLVNFQGLRRIAQRLDEQQIHHYRQLLNARRYVYALRKLAAHATHRNLARAYTTYADAIDARVAAGVMERGFFFQADRQAFFAALPSMSLVEKRDLASRVASESLKQLKSEPYPELVIRYSAALSRMGALSFSDKPMAERQRSLAQDYAVAEQLLTKLIEPTTIDAPTAERLSQLLREYRNNFVSLTPARAEGGLKYYEARVGYEFVSPECAQEFETTTIEVTLLSQTAGSAVTVPLKIVPNERPA
jgi:hypothetical protein